MRAVLLVDHGSRFAEANVQLVRVAALLNERLPERLVAVAHMELAAPGIEEAVDALVARGATEIVVHPYFLAPGIHSSRDIPDRVQKAALRHPELRVRMTPPLGVHAGIIDALVDRIRDSEE